MKLKYQFIINQIGDNYVAVPVADEVIGFNGALKLNDTAAYIINKLNDEIKYDELINDVKGHFECEKEDAAENVDSIINGLKENGLLTE